MTSDFANGENTVEIIQLLQLDPLWLHLTFAYVI